MPKGEIVGMFTVGSVLVIDGKNSTRQVPKSSEPSIVRGHVVKDHHFAD
jgi:hypothetical protein